jgi:hypothetical protein
VGGTFSTTGDGKTASGIMIGAKQWKILKR